MGVAFTQLRFSPDEAGQGLAEYTMILALAVIVCVAAVSAIGQTVVSSPAWALANVL